MTTTIYQGRRPRLEAADIRVVIDVIRAFTTTHVAFLSGASRILLAETVDDARRLAGEEQHRILAGERQAVAPPGFDLGNSPAEMDETDVAGREIVLTTSNGVQATLHADFDGPLFVTGFSNAGTTVRYLQQMVDGGARRIQLLASHPDGDEDLACAQWIRARLTGDKLPDDPTVERRIRNCAAAQKFLDSRQRDYRADDIDYCARRFDSPWAMKVDSSAGAPIVTRHGAE